MSYKVKINEFEGPLDLLLHLIKESNIDIYDISIEEITKQYLNYINQMESLDIEVASEYLVMAAELMLIKSKTLLPKKNEEVEELEEAEEYSRENLINRLIEYQKYKNVTKDFRNLENIRHEIYTKAPENLKDYNDENIVLRSDVSLDDLLDAFHKFLQRKALEKPLKTNITKKEITVEQRRTTIKHILKEKKKIDFFELFDVITKEYVVVTFLAVLEMAKKQELYIKQENNFDKIICEVVE